MASHCREICGPHIYVKHPIKDDDGTQFGLRCWTLIQSVSTPFPISLSSSPFCHHSSPKLHRKLCLEGPQMGWSWQVGLINKEERKDMMMVMMLEMMVERRRFYWVSNIVFPKIPNQPTDLNYRDFIGTDLNYRDFIG